MVTEQVGHSPAPWRIALVLPQPGQDMKWHHYSLVSEKVPNHKQARANAKLMSAAPELLQAAILALEEIDELDRRYESNPAWIALKAAIELSQAK